jgi:hypothetical protein
MWMIEHISVYRRIRDTDPVRGPLPFAVERGGSGPTTGET